MEHNAVTDAQLLAEVAAGDQGALRALVERHARWLTVRLGRRTNDAELVASAVQDTFVAVWHHARRYRGDGPVGAWLWGIAIRQLLSRLRTAPAPTPHPWETIAAAAPVVSSAEDELLLALEHTDVGDALDRLSPQLRQALLATVVDGLTSAEAARLLGIPVGTVKSRVRLAKAQLRTRLIGGLA